jgi:hypothetical protein
MAEIWSYQQFSCQRCGTFVSADPFGSGAYMVKPHTRVCGMCYDELTRTNSAVQRRLARRPCTRTNTPIGVPGSLWTHSVSST